jgi:hypothetical protein
VRGAVFVRVKGRLTMAQHYAKNKAVGVMKPGALVDVNLSS